MRKLLILVVGLAGLALATAGTLGSRSAGAVDAQCTFYGNGSLRSKVPYRGGQREGLAREWHPNGRLASEGAYHLGEREGPWSFWSEDGALDAVRSGSYASGQRQP